MGKYFKKGEGDYYYSRKEWANEAAKSARSKSFRATVHGPKKDSAGRRMWEVRVRIKK